METCRSCEAFLQPEWDRCKICGTSRLPAPAPPAAAPGPVGPGGPPRAFTGPATGRTGGMGPAPVIVGVVGLLLVALAAIYALRPSEPVTTVAAQPGTETVVGLALPTTLATTTTVAESYLSVTPTLLRSLCAGEITAVSPAQTYPGPTGAPHVLAISHADPVNVLEQGINDMVESSWLTYWETNHERPVELVFCVRAEPIGAPQDCGWYGMDQKVAITDATWIFELRSSTTGEVLASSTAPGVSDCPNQLYYKQGDPRERTISRLPDEAAVRAFLEPFVLAP